METIAAIATPHAQGGISVIRISGDKALDIAGKVFKPLSGRDISEMKGYTAAYGEICDSDGRLDDGVLLVYRAPHSYTGEDTAEISCHGGIFITERVLSACCAAGAVPAQPGEFTKRAFLNGKLSLTQAEAVADVIEAQNGQFLKCCKAQQEGALYRQIKKAEEIILSFTALVQAWIDYPDEMEDELDGGIEAVLDGLLDGYNEGRMLRTGIPCAIVGRPNAGKSTLMNLMSGTQKSIVTDIEGTTRDIVEETVMLGGVMLRLSDCAGIRETSDRVESIGVELMLKRADESALIFAVFDSGRELGAEDMRLIDIIKDKNVICIANKNDLPEKADIALLEKTFGSVISISAKESVSAEILAREVKQRAGMGSLDPAAGFIANERQKKCVTEARDMIKSAYDALLSGVTPDAAGVMCENALDRLYELSGERASDRVIDEVFRNFCVGK